MARLPDHHSALSGTTYLSLIYDITPERQRTRAVSVVWFFLITGFAVAGIAYGRLLPQYTREGFLARTGYLGGVRFSTLARAGRVVTQTPDALARADAMFASEPAPWCATPF